MQKVKFIEKQEDTGFRLAIKRCYLPFKVTSECPSCGVDVTMDLLEDYLSFPNVGNPTPVNFYHVCKEKDVEWQAWVIVEFTMTAV